MFRKLEHGNGEASVKPLSLFNHFIDHHDDINDWHETNQQSSLDWHHTHSIGLGHSAEWTGPITEASGWSECNSEKLVLTERWTSDSCAAGISGVPVLEFSTAPTFMSSDPTLNVPDYNIGLIVR